MIPLLLFRITGTEPVPVVLPEPGLPATAAAARTTQARSAPMSAMMPFFTFSLPWV